METAQESLMASMFTLLQLATLCEVAENRLQHPGAHRGVGTVVSEPAPRVLAINAP